MVNQPSHPARAQTIALWIAIGGLWLFLFNQVKWDWIVNPHYSFGWAVPILGAYLLHERWLQRPNPRTPPLRPLWIGLLGVALLLLVPLRLIQEVNTDWRLASWALALTVAAASGLLLLLAGGTPWARHFVFPIAFLLLAVPWPRAVETPLIQTMMRVVTALVVEVLNAVNIPAIQQGNLVELSTGRVGVEEACSGIQSFQSAVMVSLFLGELFLLGVGRRTALLAGSVAWAYACNFFRTFFLAYMVSKDGPGAVAEWHDPAGLTLMVVCFAGIIGLALLIAPKSAPRPPASPSAFPKPSPTPVAVALAGWLVLVEAGTIAWFAFHEARGNLAPAWGARFPEEKPDYETFEPSYAERSLLRFNEGHKVMWNEPDGTRWGYYFFRWNQGNARASNNLKHTPEICLTGAGLELLEDHGIRTYEAHGIRIPFDTYTFLKQGRPIHVFYCIWMDKVPTGDKQDLQMDWSLRGRLQRVLNGIRPSSQQVVEITAYGLSSFDLAEQRFVRLLPELVQPLANPEP